MQVTTNCVIHDKDESSSSGIELSAHIAVELPDTNHQRHGMGTVQARLTSRGIEGMRLDDLVRVFTEEGWGAELTFVDFERAVRRLLVLQSGQEGKAMVEHLFRLFDVNQNGTIDWREFVYGMTVLCDGLSLIHI